LFLAFTLFFRKVFSPPPPPCGYCGRLGTVRFPPHTTAGGGKEKQGGTEKGKNSRGRNWRGRFVRAATKAKTSGALAGAASGSPIRTACSYFTCAVCRRVGRRVSPLLDARLGHYPYSRSELGKIKSDCFRSPAMCRRVVISQGPFLRRIGLFAPGRPFSNSV